MLLVCQACTCRFAVDLKMCPQCGSTDFVHESQLEVPPPDPTVAGSMPPPSSPGSSAGPSEDGAGEQQG